MNDSVETKICPFCAEQIKAAARVCPFCQSRQSRWANWWYEYAAVLMGLLLIVLAGVLVEWVVPDGGDAGGRSFAGHRNELAVVGTSLDRTETNRDFWLVGYVTNRGKYPWRVRALEVRFVDSRGSLLDVRHSNVQDPFVVSPLHDHPVRIWLGELAFTNAEVAPQVLVQRATDGDRPLKRD